MKSMRPHVVLVAVCVAVATCLSPSATPAQTTYTWDGEPDGGGTSANGNWTTASNWVGDTAPTDGSFNHYKFGGNTNLISNNNLTPTAGGVNVDDIEFLSGAGAFTLTGVYLDMLGSTTNSDTADVVNNSSSTQTIALRLEARPDFTSALVFGTASGDIVVTGQVTSSSNSTTEYVRKTGSHTLTFSTNNTYGSTTQVNEGALQITNGGALGATSAGTTVANNARLELSGGITVSGESLTIVGNGGDYYGAVRSVDGTNVWNGSVTLSSSGARIGATGGSVLEVQGDISGGSNLLAVRTDTSSTVVLSGSGNSYGDTMVVAGTLQIDGGDDRLPTGGVLRMGNGSNVDFAAFDLNGNNQRVAGLLSEGTTMTMTVTNTSGTAATLTVNNSANYTYGGVIAGNLALDKQGAGTLTLTNDKDHTFTGDTNVREGVLDIYSAGLPGDVIVHDTATLLLRSPGFDSIDDSADVTVNTGGLMDVRENENIGGLYGNGTVDNTTGSHFLGVNYGNFTGTITDSGGSLELQKIGSGTLILTGNNTYSGNTRVIEGVLQIGNTGDNGEIAGDITVEDGGTLRLRNPGANSVDDSGDLTVDAGGLVDTQENENIGGLFGSGTVDNTGGSYFLGINYGDFSGTITDSSGSLRLEKNSSGVLTLGGDNSYSGGTIVRDGTLLINNTTGSGTGSGTVTVSGGTLGGNGSIDGLVTVASGGTLGPGTSPGILTLNNGLTFTGGTYEVDIEGTTAGTGYDQVVVTSGNVDLGLGVADLLLNVDSGFSAAIDDYLWIIDNTGTGTTSGYFTGLDDGGSVDVNGRRFYIYYNADHDTAALLGGNDVLLTSVPEPSALAMLLGLAGIGLLGYFRRRNVNTLARIT